MSDMGKKVWIMNHYAAGMFFEKGGRHYNFSKYLARAGYEPVVFCCNALHNSKAALAFPEMQGLWEIREAKEIHTPFVVVKGRAYIGNGKQRVLNMLDYYRNVQKAVIEYAATHGKPDIIVGSSVHPLACVAAIKLSKQLKCKNIVEIRDLWPESIVAYNVASKNNPIVKLLYCLEKWIYTKADAIIFTMEGGRDYIIGKGWDTDHGGPVDLNKVHHINNGVDLEEFNYNREHYTISDPDLDDPTTFKVVYTGSIRKVNGLQQLVEAAKCLKKVKQIQLLIYGEGDERQALQDLATAKQLNNIHFKGKVEKKYVPYILSKADLCLLHWQTTPITKYGMSMNKFFEYVASGNPLITNLQTKYDLIARYDCGFHIDYTDPDRAAEELERIAATDLTPFAENSRRAAADYDFSQLTKKLVELLEVPNA